MKQPNRPKTDNLAWIGALLFPKKSKAITGPAKGPVVSAAPATARPKTVFPQPGNTAGSSVRQPTTAKPKTAFFQPAKLFPAFWTVASGLSFIVNVILIVTVVVMAQELFALKRIVGSNLLGGLYENFILMDLAHIKTNIAVADDVPVNFSLHISQDTIVTLTQATRITGAQVALTSGGVNINAPANIVLPAGTNLPVHLELTVPVDTTIPIKLNVPVDIPLQETELHRPFIGLQGVVSPYYWMLQPQVNSAADLEACKPFVWFCEAFFK